MSDTAAGGCSVPPVHCVHTVRAWNTQYVGSPLLLVWLWARHTGIEHGGCGQ
jgi:hypothetical protein